MSIEAVVIHTDGGSRGNPGPAAAGFWVPSTRTGGSLFLGDETNNVAEYRGVILALEYALANRIRAVHIKADSKLIVNQISGVWGINFPHLRELCDKVLTLVSKGLDEFTITYVPRAQNSEADRECNECMDRAAGIYNNDASGFFV